MAIRRKSRLSFKALLKHNGDRRGSVEHTMHTNVDSNRSLLAADALMTAMDETSGEEMAQLANVLKSLSRTQEATIQAIADLRAAVGELNCAVKETGTRRMHGTRPSSTETGTGNGRQQRRASGENARPAPQAAVEPEGDLFDRKKVRLDGLEVYAVVSAVTAGTLVGVLDSYHPGDIVDMFHAGRYLEVIMSFAFLIAGTVGIVCGLHCIFVFSLITMYGRTALGMERDEPLEVFFGGTGMQRYRGFKSFVWSLYALMVELVVVTTSKISDRPSIHLASLCLTMTLMYYVYRDTQVIMDKAGVIFARTDLGESTEKGSSVDERTHQPMESEAEEKVDGTHGRSIVRNVAADEPLLTNDDDDSLSSLPLPVVKPQRGRLHKQVSAFHVSARDLINS